MYYLPLSCYRTLMVTCVSRSASVGERGLSRARQEYGFGDELTSENLLYWTADVRDEDEDEDEEDLDQPLTMPIFSWFGRLSTDQIEQVLSAYRLHVIDSNWIQEDFSEIVHNFMIASGFEYVE